MRFFQKAGLKVVWYDEDLKVISNIGLLVIGGNCLVSTSHKHMLDEDLLAKSSPLDHHDL